MYGSEIWEIDRQESIERVHNYACKRYMRVRLKASNDAALGDCGRYPMYIVSAKRCLKYWMKILKMQDHIQGENLCHNHVLITVNIFSIERK